VDVESEPPVLITATRDSATAECHRCAWRGLAWDARTVTTLWAEHWLETHTDDGEDET